jgi:hypothetical protein
MLMKIVKAAYAVALGLLLLAATSAVIGFTLGFCYSIIKYAFTFWSF